METPQQRLERESREVEQALRGLFAMPLDDGQLRQGMEELARPWAFPRLLALWGPGLYFRNRVVFRPFILAHFPVFTTDVSGRPSSPFEGPSADLFKQWLEEVERRGDVELFRRLYSLQHQGLSWEARSVLWREDLRAPYAMACTPVERQAVLNRFDLSKAQRVDDQVSGMAVMSDQSVWVGSWSRGLALLDPNGNRLRTLSTELVDGKGYVSAVVGDPLDNSVWAGASWGGGLSLVQGTTVLKYGSGVLPSELVWMRIADIQVDRSSNPRRIRMAFQGNDTTPGAIGVFSGP